MQKTLTRSGLDSNMLKLIAIAAMTADHIAWLLFPGYPTDPRDIKKYTARLFVFAVISHFAYIFASNDFADWHSFIPFYYGNILNQTSVIWSLAWGLVLLRIADNSKIKMPAKVILTLLICAVALPAEKADCLVYALGYSLYSCIFLRYRQNIRADTALCCARDTAALFI